jgi:hypothetical protein
LAASDIQVEKKDVAEKKEEVSVKQVVEDTKEAIEKKIKAARKKLRQITDLEAKEELTESEQEKIKKKADLTDELSSLVSKVKI